MNKKIYSFLSKKSNILKVSGQVAKFEGNEVKVVGLDFVYKMKVSGAKVNPAVTVSLNDFTAVANLLREFYVEKRLPKKLVLKSRFAEVSLPTKEDSFDCIVHNILSDSETIGIGDRFVSSYIYLNKFFQPQTVFFRNENRAFFTSEVSPYLGIITSEFPKEIVGNYGSISEDVTFISGATVSWYRLPRTWHLVIGQQIDNEEIYIVFSAMKPAEVSYVKPIMDVVNKIYDCLSSTFVTFVVPEELAKLVSFPSARSLVFDKNTISITTDTFNAKFDVDIEFPTRVEVLCSSVGDFLSRLPNKPVSIALLEDKRYFYYIDEENGVELILPF